MSPQQNGGQCVPRAQGWSHAPFSKEAPQSQKRSSKQNRPPVAAGQFEGFADVGSLSISHINAQIAACARRGDAARAEEMFIRMNRWGIRPSRCTFNSIINAHKVRGDMKTAEVWFRRLANSGMEPNSVTYTMMISGCAEVADVQSAERWFQEMQSRSCPPTEHTYNALIKAYANAGDWQGAEERLVSLAQLSDQMKPNVVAYNIVIQACGSAGLQDRAMHWYKELLAAGLRPTQGSVCSLMKGCHASDITDSTQIDNLPKLMDQYGLPKIDVNYGMVIRASARRGDVNQAAALFEQMIAYGQPCSLSSYNSMIHACTQTGHIGLAEHYLRLMERYQIDPDLISYNTVINACAAAGDTKKAEQWFLHMMQRGMKPNLVTYGTVCKAYARQGDAESVKKVMQVLEQSGLELNEYFYGSLIAAYGASCPPNLKGAEAAFQELVRRGLQPQNVKRVLMRSVGESRTLQLLESARATAYSNEEKAALPRTSENVHKGPHANGRATGNGGKRAIHNKDPAGPDLALASQQKKDLTESLHLASKMAYAALGTYSNGHGEKMARREFDHEPDPQFEGFSTSEGEPSIHESSSAYSTENSYYSTDATSSAVEPGLLMDEGIEELKLDSAFPESWRAWRITL